MIYATSPGSKSLVFSSSDAKAKSTWRVKDDEKEEARQGYGKHLDISRVQFFKSGMGVQQSWVLFRQLCKRPLFENLWCQLSMSIVYNLQNEDPIIASFTFLSSFFVSPSNVERPSASKLFASSCIALTALFSKLKTSLDPMCLSFDKIYQVEIVWFPT